MPRAIAALVLGMAALTLASPPPARAEVAHRCPTRTEVAHLLKLAGTGWQTACKAEERGQLLLAAFEPATGTGAAKLVVAVTRHNEVARHLATTIDPSTDKRVAEALRSGEEWALRVSRTRLGGQDLTKVSLQTKWGGNLLASYEIVAFFREAGDGLALLWSGIGDWEENRFDICLLKARASFRLDTSVKSEARGRFERTTRITRRKGPAPVEEELAKQVQKECVAPPVQREVFTVAVPPL